MPREDKFSDVPHAARKYLAEVERKRQSMNSRSPGSGDEYVKGQIRASKGTPKKATSKYTSSRAASKAAAKPAATPAPSRNYQGPPAPAKRTATSRAASRAK